MQWTQILTGLAVVSASLAIHLPVQGQTRADEVILEMAQAYRKNDRPRLTQLMPQARGHVLEPLAAYWELRVRLDTASEAEIQGFMQRYSGSYYEDRLRTDWLQQLGRRRDWSAVAAEFPKYRMRDDREVRCYALAADAILSRTEVSADAVRLWHAQREADDGCTYLIDHLHSGRKIEPLVLWRKARMAIEAGRQAAARDAVEIEAPRLSEQIALIHSDPARYLDKRIIAITRSRRELAVLALIRLATQDPDQAASLLEKRWSLQLTAEERDWTWAVIGRQSALRLSGDAAHYFGQVRDDSHLSDELLGWKIRAALRAGQWSAVRKAYDAMGSEAQKDSTWIYWNARALLALAPRLTLSQQEAQRQKAREALRGIASVRGFYEQLALEELGQAITVPERPAPLSAAEKAAAANHPGLQRALYAIGIGLRAEGNREWNYSANLHEPGGMNDRELLAAADLACEKQVWDRCINSSDRTKQVIHLEQRYPMPLRETVLRKAQATPIDPAFVYGLIRQESRFIMDARSTVGASGLMQVMPATAKWTARKIGLSSFTPAQLNDRDVNVTIGTAYLKLVLDDFGGSMPMAAAAYNAGPSRPRNWRNGPLLEGAIWAENVPFTETRDYVKKVLSNTTNYAALITGQPQSLKDRLGTVAPRSGGAPPPNEDLP